MFVVRFTQRPT